MRIIDWSSDVCSSDLELLAFRNLPDHALSTLDSIPTLFPSHALHDDILMARSNIFTKQGKLEKAVAALERLTTEYSYDIWADDALFKLGTLYETQLKAPEKAMSWYEKLLLDHPGSLYVTEARSEEHTSELQSLMRISYAVFCL